MALLFCGTWAVAADLPPEQVEFFESKIRPIFAEHCYKCHSNESGKSKGGLQLDTRDALRKGGGGGAVIVAGDPETSPLIEAVRYKNEDLQMPPADEGGKLSAEQIAALEQWVKLGAPDPRVGGKPHPMDMVKARQHWAFQPVAKPATPAVKNAKWVSTPVDAFVLAQLEAKGLAPAVPADARTLLRRVTYDLTGLPPTPAEMDAFLGDRSADAYAKVVDRLLASPRYGERWGRFWLDVARYADTKGYLAGNVERRYAFSHTYRDYVIRAFNEDKPFDKFIVEQLAADHLPLGEDKSALAALGFVTLGRRFLNNQNDIIDDRIDVVTRGLMGLTVSCARCHDHKFDPIPTADYYSLHGVFASSEEPVDKPLLGPLVESPAYEGFLKKKADLEAKIKGREADEVKKFFAGVREKTGDYLLAVHDLAALPKTEKIELFAGPRKLNVEVLKRWQSFLTERVKAHDPVLAPWFALAALPENAFTENAVGLVAEWKELGARSPAFRRNPEKAPPEGGTTNEDTVNGDVLAAFTKSEKPLTSLKDAAVIYNGIFAKHAAAVEAPADATPEQRAIRDLLFADHTPSKLGYDEVARMLKRQIDTKTAPLKREIEALNWTEPGAPLRAMALADRATPVNTKIFLRGNPANRGAEAPRQFLEVLAGDHRTPFKRGSGRLDLAEEIVNPKNPLTARVFVNRVWGWHFGDALVRTPSDFGVRTEPPVQRALLDWLAASFVEQGWSVKQLHRAIVLSSTYRQSSDRSHQLSVASNRSLATAAKDRSLITDNRLPITDRAAAADPDNRLIHRFNRRRLELEALRDTLLAVAGTLDTKAGGIPDDLTKEPFATRRTVYGFIDRQNLPGMFRTFDYPNPDVSSSGRFATTVPQQALFMMNSGFAQEQARRLVQHPMVKSVISPGEKIAALYRVVFQRTVERDEMNLALEFVRRPEIAAELRPSASAGWQYGQGYFDEATGRVRDFQVMTVRKDGRVSPVAAFPDEKFGRLSVSAIGGHPGKNPAVASIRRWQVPGRGKVKIEGTLGHANANGDGVRGRIVSSQGGRQGEWTVHNKKAETKLELEVHAGETLDFVVDGGATSGFDTYTWAPTIAFTPDTDASYLSARTWNAKTDFEKDAKPVAPLTRWEELAQVLLLSNELAFVD